MKPLGQQIARLAHRLAHDAYSLSTACRQFRHGPPLSPEQVTLVFETGGTVASARAVASRLGRKIKVVGWRSKFRRTIDAAAASGLSEATAIAVLHVLTSPTLRDAPDGMRISSIEAMLATCPEAELRLFGGLSND